MEKNENIIKTLNAIVEGNYHFSDYEIQNIAIDRRNVLIETYRGFVQKLIEKLYEKNNIGEVNDFINQYTLDIDSKLFFQHEYEILMLKLNEISYWIFSNNFPLEYYRKNYLNLIYCR